jgi:uncharacterized membrane protein YvbJ
MFCPYCGKNNQEDAVFCEYCKKAMPKGNAQTSSPNPSPTPVQPQIEQKKPKKPLLSFTAIKGIITVVMLAVLILIIIWLYYPSMLPWNW